MELMEKFQDAYDFLYENICPRTCNLQDEKDSFQENYLRDENFEQKNSAPAG